MALDAFYCVNPGVNVEAKMTFYEDNFTGGSCAELAEKYPKSQQRYNNGVYWTLKHPNNSRLGCFFHTSKYTIPDLCTKVTMRGQHVDTIESVGPASETDLCNHSTQNCSKFI